MSPMVFADFLAKQKVTYTTHYSIQGIKSCYSNLSLKNLNANFWTAAWIFHDKKLKKHKDKDISKENINYETWILKVGQSIRGIEQDREK